MSPSRRHFLGACAATLIASRRSFADALPQNALGQKDLPQNASNRQLLRVALVCDTHTNRLVEGDHPLYRARFEAVIADVNAQKVDFVLLGGDLTEGGKPELIADFKAQAARFQAPQLCVAGNHDVGAKKVEGQKSALSNERVTRFEAAFGPSFWVQEIGGARIIGVNASVFGSGLERELAQWEFLETALAKPIAAPFGTHLLTHYPPFLNSPDEPSDPYWNIEPGPRARLLELMRTARVRGVFSGHLHRPLFNQSGNFTLITAPPVSFGLPRGKQPQGWTLLFLAPGGAITSQVRSIAL